MINISYYYYCGGQILESFHSATETFCSLEILSPDTKNLATKKNQPRIVSIGGNDQRADSFSLIVTNIAALTS